MAEARRGIEAEQSRKRYDVRFYFFMSIIMDEQAIDTLIVTAGGRGDSQRNRRTQPGGVLSPPWSTPSEACGLSLLALVEKG
jgi:hypothetical protein